MLNIGKLGPGAANYYVDQIASSAEDYYLGHGEAAGRWVGSLAERLGLRGTVGETEFRRVLDGRHPFTGQYLTTAQGSAGRAAARRSQTTDAALPGALLDTLQAACQLGLSEQRVRQLLAAGSRAAETRSAELAAGAEASPLPKNYLMGTKVERADGKHGDAWRVAQCEVERFLATRKESKARPGYDLVLRPPKSVSILWALGDQRVRAVVRDAHEQAVDETVGFIESQAVSARSQGSRTATYGVVAAAFDHRTSRAGDPLLHSHVVTANMTRTVDGKWRALDARGLFDHARPGGALYQAHLRHLLTQELGVAWEPVVNGHADVAGVPRPVIDAFSKRREEITDLVAEAGLSSAKAHQAATLASRQAKDYGVDPETLQVGWRAEATAWGFSAGDIDACLGRTQPQPITPERVEAIVAHLASSGGLTERAASFDRGDVLIALATELGGDATASDLEGLAARFLGSERVTPLVGATTGRQRTIVWNRAGATVPVLGEVRFTTPELLDIEARVLGWAEHGFGTTGPAALPTAIEGALASRPELTAEQLAMVRAVCTSEESLQPIVGRAGSGKTHALGACAEALVASGVPVVGCSVSATAAARLEESVGLERLTGRACDTVARLLIELDDPATGGFRPGTVCIVDEASALGTRDLARLAGHLHRAGGALKLIGDPDQLSSVDVGGAFRAIAELRGEHLVALTANNRQQDEEERLAVADYRQGRIAEALARYDEAGKVVRSPTATQSLDAMAADWYADHLAGIDAPMIAGPNALRRQLNARARALLKADGTITGPELRVGGIAFCAGDKIVTRENDRRLRAPGRQAFVKNGSRGTVVSVDPDGPSLLVDFEREGRIRLPADYLERGKVEHAYAQTNFLAQGSDQRRTKYHPTDASRFEEGYVGITRAVEETRIYIIDGHRDHDDDDLVHTRAELLDTGLTTIIEALARRGAQDMAHDLDPEATLSGVGPVTRTLCDLRLEREQLDADLSRAPAAVDLPLAAVVRRRDELLARKQVWAEKLGQLEPAADRQPKGGSKPRTTRARRELAAVERDLGRAARTIAGLQRRATQRREFLATHHFEQEQRDRLQRLEHARELQVRLGATDAPPATLLARLGPRPVDERRRQLWSRAIEDSAVLCDRYGTGVPSLLEPSALSDHRLREVRKTIDAVAAEAETASVEIA